jgi:osmotically inducible protein OsmC
MKINRHGTAQWQGGTRDGKGKLSTESGALDACPYGFAGRFEGQSGTNPEELIGAAHAGCFTMALSLLLSQSRLSAEYMETTATVTMEQSDGSYSITGVHLRLKAKIPGADQETFQRLAGMAKSGCPVSKLLRTEITLDALLVT